jgi:hypothetical protein
MTDQHKFLITHPMTDQRCLTSAIARQNALTVGPWNSSSPSDCRLAQVPIHFIVAFNDIYGIKEVALFFF